MFEEILDEIPEAIQAKPGQTQRNTSLNTPFLKEILENLLDETRENPQNSSRILKSIHIKSNTILSES